MTATAEDARTVDELLNFILDSGQPKYLLFWGHQPPPTGGAGKGCLSQWWPAPFTVDGISYRSEEHFMMTAKALLFGDTSSADRIRAAPHPRAAKTLGREVRGFDEHAGPWLAGGRASPGPAEGRRRTLRRVRSRNRVSSTAAAPVCTASAYCGRRL
jgi:hypothetical protein